MVKQTAKKIVLKVAGGGLGWAILNVFLFKPAEKIRGARLFVESRRTLDAAAKMAKDICPDLIVRHGPFAGMKYPAVLSSGSVIIPKLLGSYEREINGIVEEACGRPYTDVVDVGSAEGYYAVGFALRLPNAKIYAFDTDPQARSSCLAMAELNRVADRVTISAFCDSRALQNLPLGRKALIISDCEGFELALFDEETIPHLERHDLLIELHDFVDINISSIIRRRFESTHDITVVESIDDLKKARTYQYEELNKYDLQMRKAFLREYRPSMMEWYFLKSRKEQV